jgi:hypothetical protein
MANPGFKGEVAAIACGNGGLSVNLNPSKILLKNVIQAEGVVMREDHWRKEPGTALFGTNTHGFADSDNVIVAMSDWHPTELIQRIVHLRGDGFLYMTSNGGTVVDAFQSATNSGTGTRFGYFVNGGSEDGTQNRKLFLFRNNFLPSYLDGDVTNDTKFANPANFTFTDWTDAHPPIVGVINNGRLWAGGVSTNPHTLWASKFGAHTDFKTTAGLATDFQVLSVFPGVGERIYALRNYQGFIVVFKYPRGIFLVDARDTDPTNWLTQQVTDVIGVAQTPYAAVQLENDILFIGSDGLMYLFSAVLAAATGQQNMEMANLAMDLQIYQFLRNAYNRNQLSQIQSVYQAFWQTAHFTLPGAGSTTNNTRFMVDFTSANRQNGEPRFSYSYRDAASCLALRRDPADFIDKPMFGDYLSDIILMEQDARTTWNAVSYPWRVQTPHTNLGEFEALLYNKFAQLADRVKNFANLEIEYLSFTLATITISVYIDFIFRRKLTVVLASPSTQVLANAPSDTGPTIFVIGTSALGGGNIISSVVRDLHAGDGKRISLLFENTNYGEDVALTHLFLGITVGDITQTPRK